MTRRLTLAATVLLAACGGSTGPEAPGTFTEEHVYVLRQIAGKALPGVTTSPGGTFRYDADTLFLKPDGTGTKVSRVHVTPVDGAPGEERWEARFTYSLRGDRLELSFVCPPDEISSCVAPPHFRGSLSGTTLRMDHAVGLPTPLDYERVSGSD